MNLLVDTIEIALIKGGAPLHAISSTQIYTKICPTEIHLFCGKNGGLFLNDVVLFCGIGVFFVLV